MNLISVKNVSKSFNENVVLNDVSVNIKEGHITGIVGRNGSGKTVLLKIITNLYYPSKGDVEINNNLSVYDDFGVLIDTGFLDSETGFNNLKLLSLLKNKISDTDIYDIMKEVKLDPFNKTKYKNYSTGMKQKLKIAQALMENPSVIILDEPFNGLDKESVRYFRDKLKSLKSAGKTIVITSHYEEDINELCDEVYEMVDGKLSVYEKE